MPKFKFRFNTLRRLREAARDETRQRLAQAQEAAQIVAARRRSIEDQLDALRQSQRSLCESQTLNVNQVLQAQRYQTSLQAQRVQLQEQADKVRAEVERRRRLVVEADQQVRVLDRLEQRQRAEHRRTEAALECKRLDEIGAARRGEFTL